MNIRIPLKRPPSTILYPGTIPMLYETKDLYLSGYLIVMGVSLDSNSKTNGQTTFRFVQTDKLKELVNQYYDLSALVNPQQYGSALKILKNILYQTNNYNNAGSTIPKNFK